jgi:hypothetical protein
MGVREMIRKYGKPAKANKYHNKRTVVDGMAFDSKREATVYTELKLLRFAGEIENIKCQVPYPMVLNGIKICDYLARILKALVVTPVVAVCRDGDGERVTAKIVLSRCIDELKKSLSSGKDLYEYLNAHPDVRDDMFNWFKSESLKGETDE